MIILKNVLNLMIKKYKRDNYLLKNEKNDYFEREKNLHVYINYI
jgi:hypothetical protein